MEILLFLFQKYSCHSLPYLVKEKKVLLKLRLGNSISADLFFRRLRFFPRMAAIWEFKKATAKARAPKNINASS